MSRIGKKPIIIPQGVEIKIEGSRVAVKGPKGELTREIRPEIRIEIKDGNLIVAPQIQTKRTNALWGLTRALLNNMVQGVVKDYEKQLEIQGIGYKAVLEGQDLVLNLGFSHPVKVKTPQGVRFSVEKNIIRISGIDKELVSQTAAKIRKLKPPEPYKGKGIRYLGEQVKRKVGKKVITAGK